MARVGILGGGPAGLGIAYDLSARGHEVTLFEAADELGGLARSFQLGDIRIERYYHFICADDTEYFKYLKRLGIESTLRWATTRMGFHYDKKLYPFSSPFDLLKCAALTPVGRLRYAALAARCSLTTNWQALDDIPAKEWLIRHLGLEAYRVTLELLLEVKFHEFHDKIRPPGSGIEFTASRARAEDRLRRSGWDISREAPTCWSTRSSPLRERQGRSS